MVSPSPGFVFLLCSERSGSNVLTKLMDAHPEYCGPSPSHLFRTFVRNLWRYGDLADDRAWSALCTDIAHYLDCQLGVWTTRWTAQRLERDCPKRSLGPLLRHVLTEEARANGKRNVFVKENQAARHLPYLLLHFPRAKYVFFVRDPRDMAYSLARSPATRGGVERAARLWRDDQRDNLEAFGMLHESGTVLLSKYEDLLASPSTELERICTFLGTAYSAGMLRFYENELTVRNAARVEAWRNLARPILTCNAGSYREGLTELEIRYIETTCRGEMARLGYVPEVATVDDEYEVVARQLGEASPRPRDPNPRSIAADEALVREHRTAVIRTILDRNLWKR